jgi:hypothetical protein
VIRSDVVIDRRAGVSREAFLAEYLQPELPVVLTDQTRTWPATSRWQPAELVRVHGDRPVRAYSHPDGLFTAWVRYRVDTTLGAVIENHDPRTFCSSELMPECPYLMDDVGIPDVLDPAWIADEASVWVQPRGNRTGLHWDTYNSVLAVIHGEKRVLLFAPEHYAQLYPCRVSGSKDLTRASWSDVDIFAPDFTRFPLLRDVHYSEVTLCAGETLLIPKHWWHAVENLGTPTIALSFFVVGQGKPELTFFVDRRTIAGLAYRLGHTGQG